MTKNNGLPPIRAHSETLSAVLKQRHKDLRDTADRFTHQEVANAIGMVDAYVSQLLRGRADTAVPKWPGRQAVAFLKAHRYTTQEVKEIAEQFGLANVLEFLKLQATGPQMRVKGGGRQVKYLGTVSAGRWGESYADDEESYADIPAHILKQHDPSDVFALDISGDSMVCDDATKSIPAGSRAYFHSTLRPRPGSTVCCRLEREDMSVIKVFKPGRDFTTLVSLNGSHRPIILDENNPARIEGVLIGLSLATD